MKAAELGLLSLDTDINTYLSFPVKHPLATQHRPITLRDLATHTSGITDREKAYRDAYTKGTVSPESLEDYLRSYFIPGGKRYAENNFLAAEPGSVYRYSNIGAALAAYVVQSATKMPFEQFTAQYVFEPLGMRDTHWFYQDAYKDRYSVLFDEKTNRFPPIP
jgi:CubicO group peptidase (beta-lactamase class C family)